MVRFVDKDIGRLDISVENPSSSALFISCSVVAVLEGQEQLIGDLPDDIFGDGPQISLALFQVFA